MEFFNWLNYPWDSRQKKTYYTGYTTPQPFNLEYLQQISFGQHTHPSL